MFIGKREQGVSFWQNHPVKNSDENDSLKESSSDSNEAVPQTIRPAARKRFVLALKT
jgi:hypothetical protein